MSGGGIPGAALQRYCVVAFSQAGAAIRGRQALEGAGVNAFVMPTPREITAGCGLSLRLPLEAWRQAGQALDASGTPRDTWRIYRMEYNDQTRTVTPME